MSLFGYKQTPEHIAKRARTISRLQRGKKRGAYKGSLRTRERHCENCGKPFKVKFPCSTIRNCSKRCGNASAVKKNSGNARHFYPVAV